MDRDFNISRGIYLSQPPHELDLHNDFDFIELHYSIERRTLFLHWRRSDRDGIAPGFPASVCVEFRGVSEFRFLPRDSELPFTEDDCLASFGYLTDEAWAAGEVIVADVTQDPDPSWLTAVKFMSGALVAVQAVSAHARIAV